MLKSRINNRLLDSTPQMQISFPRKFCLLLTVAGKFSYSSLRLYEGTRHILLQYNITILSVVQIKTVMDMQSANNDSYTPLRANRLSARQLWIRVSVIVGLIVNYVVAFRTIIDNLGQLGTTIILLPVAVAGLILGNRAGFLTGLTCIILNIWLLTSTTSQPLGEAILNATPGAAMVLIVGYFAGKLNEVSSARSRFEGELRHHERFLALINMATRNILKPKKPDQTYFHLITNLANLFVADSAYLVQWNEETGRPVLLAASRSLDLPINDFVLDPSEASLTAKMMQTRRVLTINDLSHLKNFNPPAIFKEDLQSTQSIFGIPLITGDYQFGAAILVYDTARDFSSEDITYAELAGNQIALALWTVRQELKIQQQLKETTALTNIGRTLAETEKVGIETVLQLIVDSIKELIPGATHAVLHLLDNDNQTLIAHAVAGYERKIQPTTIMHVGEGIAGQVMASGEIISIPDILTDSRFLGNPGSVKYRSLIVAPIRTNQRSLGTISIHSDQPNAFTSGQSQLLGALGAQAAVAIENARLLETTRHDLKEINALYRITQGLAASLDADQLMTDVANLLKQNFGYYHVQVFMVDPETGDMLVRQGSGEIGAQLVANKYRLPAGTGIIGHTAATGEPFVTNNVEEVVFFVRDPLLPDTQSEMTIPIKIEDQVLGVLDIQHVPPYRLTSRDMDLMMAVADQLAVALQKAQLYSGLQEALHNEQTTRSQLIHSERLAIAGRLLASVSHEMNNPLQAIQNVLFLLKDEKNLSVQGKQDLELVLSESERMATLLDRLRATYRPLSVEDFQPVQINNLLEDVSALMATHFRHNKITFEFHTVPDLPSVPGLSDQLRQVILNMFLNAAEAMPDGGCLSVATKVLTKKGEIMITVKDTGVGIDPAILPNIFDAFVTNKKAGTGLGLAMAYEIVTKHGGRIQAENNPRGGATFTVWLPVGKASRK
jgi:signal transduction histidine kinase